MEKTADVIIIGGGIIGTSIAAFLSEKMAGTIVLLEKGLMGEGSTSRCAGGIRCQFTTPVNIQFSLLSLKILETFEERFGVDPEFHPSGYLFLAQTPVELQGLQAGSDLQRSFGVDVEVLTPEEIGSRWPFLNTGDLSGGTFCGKDGYAGPYEVLTGYVKKARENGVKIYEETEVIDILTEGEKILGVKTAKGDLISTRCVVDAAGPYAGLVAEMAGVTLPIRPLKRQLFTTAPFPGLPVEIPLTIDLHIGWYIRREGKGFLISGPQSEDYGFSLDTDFKGQQFAAINAMHRIPTLEKATINNSWGGLYAITPDNHAIIGPHPALEGFIIAGGYSGHGFQHSPATGIVVAELIADGTVSSLEIQPLSADRFEKGNMNKEILTAFRD
ncbi:MAG: FAD-binding oxidoreductase [Deltaproteobacteria bacterium]|nr:MAG: FAD-binding oxidoreductase [Deltaproteobacteria bacterium]